MLLMGMYIEEQLDNSATQPSNSLSRSVPLDNSFHSCLPNTSSEVHEAKAIFITLKCFFLLFYSHYLLNVQ